MDIHPHPVIGSGSVAKSSFMWIINDYTNFHNSVKFRDRVVSPMFSTVAGDTEHKWRVDLYPRGTDITCEDWFCIFMVNLSDVDVQASCNFVILDEKYRRVRKKFSDMKMFRRNYNEDVFWGSGSFFKCDYMFDERNRILMGDKLRVYCEITEFVIEVSAMCYYSSRF